MKAIRCATAAALGQAAFRSKARMIASTLSFAAKIRDVLLPKTMMIGSIAKMRSLTRCRIKSYKGKAGRRQLRNTTKLRSRQHYAI